MRAGMATLAPEAAFEPIALRLRDGREVTLRAVRVDDGERLRSAIRRLSPESRYTRFFSPLRDLTPRMVERATHPDAALELQLVAVAGKGGEEEIVAGARYAATPERSQDCEFAVTVADDWHRVGLARHLLEALMRTARARGFERMEGYILSTNAAMLGLATKLGFAAVASPEGPTVTLMRRDLGTIA
jgi:GNAT superfamily N-acetyltransferase